GTPRHCCELAAAAIQAVLVEAVPEEGTGTSAGRRRTPEVVRTMAAANITWGAPRIHGELLKLGFQISERTVSRLMPKQRKPLDPIDFFLQKWDHRAWTNKHVPSAKHSTK